MSRSGICLVLRLSPNNHLPKNSRMPFRYIIGKTNLTKQSLSVVSNTPQNIWRRTMLHPKRYLAGSSLSTKLAIPGVVGTMIPIRFHTAYENVSWPWFRSSLHTLVTSV